MSNAQQLALTFEVSLDVFPAIAGAGSSATHPAANGGKPKDKPAKGAGKPKGKGK
jgi:hypothetical protein